VPLVVIQDYLSIAWASHFSVLLGLALLAVVFFIPNGLIGLLQAARARAKVHSFADFLESWAARLRGGRSPPPQRTTEPRARQNGAGARGAPLGTASDDARKAHR
jgi:hypothetical protein